MLDYWLWSSFPSLYWRYLAYLFDIGIVAAPFVVLTLAFDVSAWLIGAFVAVMVLFVVYDALLTAKDGQTLGKRLFGVRVVEVDTGRPPRLSRALTRSIFKLLVIPLLPVEFFWVLLNVNGRAMHDLPASTIVVKLD